MNPGVPVSMLLASRRILVLGPSGSGKSHFSARLARILDVGVIHLDAAFWKPGWVSTPADEWDAVVKDLVSNDSWIMDGTYERSLHLRVPAAELVILFESRRWACLWRVVKRKLFEDRLGRVDAPPGQPINRAFLRYIWNYPRLTRPAVLESIKEHGRQETVLVLKGPREAIRLLQLLREHVGSFGRSPALVLGQPARL
jgi:adenylate kinase family enzyme